MVSRGLPPFYYTVFSRLEEYVVGELRDWFGQGFRCWGSQRCEPQGLSGPVLSYLEPFGITFGIRAGGGMGLVQFVIARTYLNEFVVEKTILLLFGVAEVCEFLALGFRSEVPGGFRHEFSRGFRHEF